MGLQILELGDEAKKKVDAIVEFAQQEANWYDPKPGAKPPGLDARYRCFLGTYRCVFSFTIDRRAKKVYRHLSISVPTRGRLPQPPVAVLIAKMFGFTGDAHPDKLVPLDWMVHVQTDHLVDDDCVVLVQDTGHTTN
jgi:hypothetical protein